MNDHTARVPCAKHGQRRCNKTFLSSARERCCVATVLGETFWVRASGFTLLISSFVERGRRIPVIGTETTELAFFNRPISPAPNAPPPPPPSAIYKARFLNLPALCACLSPARYLPLQRSTGSCLVPTVRPSATSVVPRASTFCARPSSSIPSAGGMQLSINRCVGGGVVRPWRRRGGGTCSSLKMAASETLNVTIKKPMGIILEENGSGFGGLRVKEVNPGGSAEVSARARWGEGERAYVSHSCLICRDL